eukprot:c12246_g1_i1.p1 GENE.c12246_g1_i1~~c12246_g1_i1.p1  ORF type:complete len:175 (+),score=89.63 c12246_g1_i1:43-567(+)
MKGELSSVAIVGVCSFGLGLLVHSLWSKKNSNSKGSDIKAYAFRAGPGEELHSKIVEFVKENNIRAGFIMTCVGSLVTARIRLANADVNHPNEIIFLENKHEIVSLVGTISPTGGHLHISLSDAEGKMVGGHVMGDCKIFTTAEVVIGDCSQLLFNRKFDERTGFPELCIECDK